MSVFWQFLTIFKTQISNFGVKNHPVRAYRPGYRDRRFFLMLAGMGTTAGQNPPVAD